MVEHSIYFVNDRLVKIPNTNDLCVKQAAPCSWHRSLGEKFLLYTRASKVSIACIQYAEDESVYTHRRKYLVRNRAFCYLLLTYFTRIIKGCILNYFLIRLERLIQFLNLGHFSYRGSLARE